MGWKGTVRSINAAIRAAERDAKRRQRELDRQYKELAKLEAFEQAALEVDRYENQLSLLTSVHTQQSDELDWHAMMTMPEPLEPKSAKDKEREARTALETYSPNFLVRVLGRESRHRQALERNLKAAIEADEAENRKAQAQYRAEHMDWAQSKELASRILSGDPAALVDAINRLEPFTDIGELGSEIKVEAHTPFRLDVEIRVHSNEVIPAESKSLLQSGKLSVKKMPVGRFNELYQDYVCSCILRIAREVHSLLPIHGAIITGSDEMLNSATGHMELTPIVSVYVPRETLDKLNFEKIDPSDALANFVHNMNFRKTSGFHPAEKVRLENVAQQPSH